VVAPEPWGRGRQRVPPVAGHRPAGGLRSPGRRHEHIAAGVAVDRGPESGELVATLARVATALDRHPIASFPENVPAKLEDAVQVA
jgi:hypothetical protein